MGCTSLNILYISLCLDIRLVYVLQGSGPPCRSTDSNIKTMQAHKDVPQIYRAKLLAPHLINVPRQKREGDSAYNLSEYLR